MKSKPALKPALKADHKDLSVPNDMTLRDYFAAKAMPLSYQFWMEDYYHPDKSDADMRAEEQRDDFDAGMKELIAESAYGMADAMLKARNA